MGAIDLLVAFKKGKSSIEEDGGMVD